MFSIRAGPSGRFCRNGGAFHHKETKKESANRINSWGLFTTSGALLTPQVYYDQTYNLNCCSWQLV